MSILGGLFKKDSGAKKENAPQKTVIVPKSGENSVKTVQKPIKVEKEEVIPVKAEIKEGEIDYLNHPKKKKIQQILNVFETGTPEGDYSNVSIFRDASGGKYKQITFGRSQTTQQSHLKELIDAYIDSNGEYSNDFKPYKGRADDLSLVNDDYFISLLKKSGKDPVMQKAQDDLFDKRYWEPAMKWAKDNGFVLSLSLLVIYDSFIHSGGILSFLRKRFPEVPPAKGGNEMDYIRSYLKVRHSWLYNKSALLRKTTYRTSNMINHLEKADWDLSHPFYANGVWIQ